MKKTIRTPRKDATPAGKKLRALGAKWLARIEKAGKDEKKWHDDAKKACEAYTNEGAADAYGAQAQAPAGYDFNILFSNVETIVPAVINSPPVPDIRRRFQDDDPAARIVADILERAIRVQIDDGRLQIELEAQAQDSFLAGRGIIRIRFHSEIVPAIPDKDDLRDAADDTATSDGEEIGSDDGIVSGEYADVNQSGAQSLLEEQRGIGDNGGPPLERLENERIRFEAVSWVDYRHGPAKRWEERPWDAFRFCIPKEDEEKSFDAALIGEQFGDSDLNERNKNGDDLTGWEIWDKDSRKVIFIDDRGTVLNRIDDPLGLSEFFCIPTPIQPISINGRLMPVNPFAIYRKLADDLDDAVRRKHRLINAMRVKGWYGISQKDLDTVVNLEDNDFAPIADPELWAQNGGLQNAIAFWPLEKFITAIQQLDTAIEQYKQWIYEITGISDIVRGASVASETATAQNIKSQWGSLRIQKMQRAMERCARDLFIMMAEIIPTKFSFQTLEEMTGIPIMVKPDDDPEKVREKLAVQQLMKRKLSSFYRIDVETDSTVRADLTRQKQEISEFLQGASAYFGAVAPLVQQGAMPADAAVEIFAATARLFNLGKSVEDTLEQTVTRAKEMAKQAAEQAQQPQGPTPEQQAAQAKMEADAQNAAMTAQSKQMEMQQTAQKFEFDMTIRQAEAEAKMVESARRAEAEGMKAQREAIVAALDEELRRVDLAIRNVELEIKQTELAIKRQPEVKVEETSMAFDGVA